MVGNAIAAAASTTVFLLLSTLSLQVAAQSILVADFELNINIGRFSFGLKNTKTMVVAAPPFATGWWERA
jgi:hypothetical protein